MESNNNSIEKFSAAPITYILVAANLIVFIVLECLGGTTDSEIMLRYGALNPYRVYHYGEWYRLFSCMFLHFGLNHLLSNMLLLFLLGQIFEKAVGTTRFTAIYIFSGFCGSFLSFMYQCLMNENDLIAGASGAIFGIVGGMLVVILVNKGHYQGISTRRMIFMIVITMYVGFTTAGTDNVGHVGGLLAGIVLTFLSYGIPTIIKSIGRDK